MGNMQSERSRTSQRKRVSLQAGMALDEVRQLSELHNGLVNHVDSLADQVRGDVTELGRRITRLQIVSEALLYVLGLLDEHAAAAAVIELALGRRWFWQRWMDAWRKQPAPPPALEIQGAFKAKCDELHREYVVLPAAARAIAVGLMVVGEFAAAAMLGNGLRALAAYVFSLPRLYLVPDSGVPVPIGRVVDAKVAVAFDGSAEDPAAEGAAV